MSFTALLNQTITIQRRRTSGGLPIQDDLGGVTEPWYNHLTSQSCRIIPLSARERAMQGREGVEASHKIIMLPDVDVAENDQGVVGSTVYEITGVEDIRGAGTNHHTRVMAVVKR